MNDLLYLIALTKVRNVGSKNAKELISHCGGAKEAFKATTRQLLRVPGIGEKIAENIRNFKDFDQAKKELEFIQNKNIQALTFFDENYPQRLKHFDDAPIILYQKGNAELNTARTVAIVGTRKTTPRGKVICERLVEDLKDYNITINSGLAYGTDVTAHRKCVELGISTIGVLGHGLDRIYPQDHKGTAQQMMKNGGLLTEFTSGTRPDAVNFPARNRIIAGMSDVIIVIETKLKGGSMITAHMANEYHKDVFAVPGRLGDEYSKGCNHLIKTHKANLIESAEDIGYIMRWEKMDSDQEAVQRQLFVELSEKERKIVEVLRQDENITVDTLAFQLKLTTGELATQMLAMEFKGIIKSLPGSRYTLI